jgi:hypothetical protein
MAMPLQMEVLPIAGQLLGHSDDRVRQRVSLGDSIRAELLRTLEFDCEVARPFEGCEKVSLEG